MDSARVYKPAPDGRRTYASHGAMSVARRNGRLLRGPVPPTQPINSYLDALREDWDSLTVAQRRDQVRNSLLFIADPVSELNEQDHDTLADLTLGEMYHARLVLMRLLPFLVASAERS